MNRLRILILGGTGMVGHKMFQVLSSRPHLEVYATARDLHGLEGWFDDEALTRIRPHVDAADFDTVIRALYLIGYNEGDRFITAEPLGPGGDPYVAMNGRPDTRMLEELVKKTVTYFREREEAVRQN